MVSTTENGDIGATQCSPCEADFPPGNYRLVGFDLDLTGRRLIDEICHIAAYTPASQFSQYVMPFRDLNVSSKYRHMLRVVTVGRYRMLKSDKTGKVLKTKSEISAMTDFVQWLEALKAEGIILVTHESRKSVPPYLLQVLRKYDLYDRFCRVVKGFANSFAFAELKCAQTVKSYNLYTLVKVLLDKDEDLDSAADRSRLSYQIVEHLCAGEGEEKGSGDAAAAETGTAAMSEGIRLVANTIDEEEKDLAGLKDLVQRQNSLRPIFGDMISSRYRVERYRANNLRRLIAEANLTYQDLEEAWAKDKKESLTALVRERVTTARKPEDLEDLTETLLGHFDPSYTPKVPRRQSKKADKSQSEGGTDAAEESGTGEKSKSPGDKASKTSSGKSSPTKFSSAPSSPAKKPEEVKTEAADTSR